MSKRYHVVMNSSFLLFIRSTKASRAAYCIGFLLPLSFLTKMVVICLDI